ncbi:MAG TPA: type II toxin-antitoxin system VapC family toxin [Thermomicrobiaceae bacterium]|nr:type II toxin-antitoxin system VapC family toxin [Thermomicrobiaceae bacterium]
MRYLLDTHAFLWWVMDDRRLSGRVRALIQDPENELLFSAASAWEIAIKARLGRIRLQGDPREVIPQQLVANGFAQLAIETPHALEVATLPLLHRDPFDRLLVAQALLEGLPLLSADPAIAQYDIPVIW